MGRVNPAELEITFGASDIRVYRLTDPTKAKPFEEFIEPIVERQAQIPGSSRADADPRRDILTWTLDDWSAGQLGDGFWSPHDERIRRGFRTSDGAVSVLEVPGALSLGKALIASKSNFASVSGWGWVFTRARKSSGDRIVAGYVGGTNIHWANLDTWTTTALGDTLNGELATDGENTYAPCAATIKRYTAADVVATFVNEGAVHAVVANERLYYYRRTAGSHTIKRAPLTGTLPVTGTQIGTVPAVNYTSNMVAVGSIVYFVTGGGAAFDLWAIINDVVTHAARLPLGFVPFGRSDGSADLGNGTLAAVGDTLLIAGQIAPMGSRFSSRAAVIVVNPGEPLQTVILPVASKDAGLGSSAGASTVAAGPGNTAYIGINFAPFAAAHRIFQFDLATGTLWRAPDGATASASDPLNTAPLAILFDPGGGATYVGRSLSTHIWRDSLNDTPVVITHHPWDFGLPAIRKLLYQVEIRADFMDDDTTIAVSFILDDDGTEITTDADGATIQLAASEGVKLKTFTLSKGTVERLFTYMEPIIELSATGQTVTPESPHVASVTFRALSTGNVRYYKYVIDCSDESSVNRRPGRQTHQRALMDELRELRDTAANRVFTVRPLYTSSGAGTMNPWPTPDDEEESFDCVVVGWHMISEEPGKGMVELTLRRLD